MVKHTCRRAAGVFPMVRSMTENSVVLLPAFIATVEGGR